MMEYISWYKIAKEKDEHSYSCVMVHVKGKLEKEILKWVKDNIREKDLDDNGIEDELHITALYGLHTNNAEEIKNKLGDMLHISAKLGKISIFTSNPDFDVLKIDVDSEDIINMNKKLRELSYTNKYDKYIPHLTLAYINKGKCKNLLGNSHFLDKQITFENIIFSTKNKDKHIISVL